MARRLRAQRPVGRATCATAPSSSRPAAATTTPARPARRRSSASACRSCGRRGRATCSRGSTGCAAGSRPRASSSTRSGSPRQRLPRRIGVVTAEGSAARRDFLAGLERRSWRGTIVWGYAPVQDRRAAPAIAAQIRDLAAVADVDAIVVTRGGGSIADLWAFCDESLCRTVALLPVPVISAVGHDVDRTLIDDVAAVCCSTPTHAAEAVVALDCAVERRRLADAARRIDRAGRLAVLRRARELGARSRAPREHLDRHRRHLHQKARELRAAVGARARTCGPSASSASAASSWSAS